MKAEAISLLWFIVEATWAYIGFWGMTYKLFVVLRPVNAMDLWLNFGTLLRMWHLFLVYSTWKLCLVSWGTLSKLADMPLTYLAFVAFDGRFSGNLPILVLRSFSEPAVATVIGLLFYLYLNYVKNNDSRISLYKS